MGTRILKIDAEIAEKTEVEVGIFNTEINFLPFSHFPNEGCQLQIQFSQPFLHQFSKSLCPSSRGDPQVSETPPEVIFLMSIGRENSKKKWQPKLNIKNILGKIYLLQSTITWLQIHQIEQVGGVLELSRPPLKDGHRDFSN